MKFTSEHKEVREFSNDYFDYGIHKVRILSIQHDTTDSGKEYIEVFFTDESGQIEDSARVWFTTDQAINFSFNTLRSILVHNTPEGEKDAARDAFDDLESTEGMVELLSSKLVGGEMWFSKYQDPQRTYEKDGRVYKSVNKNIYGYEPKLKPELMPQRSTESAGHDEPMSSPGDISPSEIPF